MFWNVSDKCFFVDLYVRVSNKVAIGMYEKFGYTVYRRVLKYYSDDEEDAFGKSSRIILEGTYHSIDRSSEGLFRLD